MMSAPPILLKDDCSAGSRPMMEVEERDSLGIRENSKETSFGLPVSGPGLCLLQVKMKMKMRMKKKKKRKRMLLRDLFLSLQEDFLDLLSDPLRHSSLGQVIHGAREKWDPFDPVPRLGRSLVQPLSEVLRLFLPFGLETEKRKREGRSGWERRGNVIVVEKGRRVR